MFGPWPWRDARGRDGLSSRPDITNKRGEGHKCPSDVGYGGDLPTLFPGHQTLWLLKGFLPAHPCLQEKTRRSGHQGKPAGRFFSLSISVAPDAPEPPGAGCSGKPAMTVNNFVGEARAGHRASTNPDPSCPHSHHFRGRNKTGRVLNKSNSKRLFTSSHR